MLTASQIRDVVKCYEPNKCIEIRPIFGGLINTTFRIVVGGESFILQAMHRIYSREATQDVDVVTAYLAKKGLVTPRILRTRDNDIIVNKHGFLWRMMTYIDGISYDKVESAQIAGEAGRMAGLFHATLAGWNHPFKFVNNDWHNTRRYINRLRSIRLGYNGTEKWNNLSSLVEEIIAMYDGLLSLPLELPHIIHGDLKINNVRFKPSGSAICLLDLDGVQRGSILAEIGDAVRSWCNAESSISESSRLNIEFFEAMMGGYLPQVKGMIPDNLLKNISHSAATIAFELAARFSEDAFRESYFKLDQVHFNDLYTQNVTSAKAQLALAKDILKNRPVLDEIIQNCRPL